MLKLLDIIFSCSVNSHLRKSFDGSSKRSFQEACTVSGRIVFLGVIATLFFVLLLLSKAIRLSDEAFIACFLIIVFSLFLFIFPLNEDTYYEIKKSPIDLTPKKEGLVTKSYFVYIIVLTIVDAVLIIF